MLTAKGTWRPIFGILSREYSGTMLLMDQGGVTPGHMLLREGTWTAARFFGFSEYDYIGKVMNLIIEVRETPAEIASPTTEHSYRLANGRVAHNFVPS